MLVVALSVARQRLAGRWLTRSWRTRPIVSGAVVLHCRPSLMVRLSRTKCFRTAAAATAAATTAATAAASSEGGRRSLPLAPCPLALIARRSPADGRAAAGGAW